MTFRGGSQFPADIALSYQNETIKGVFSAYENGKYDVAFSDSTGNWSAHFEGLALNERALGMFAAGDPSLTSDQSARLRGIIAFTAVVESLRQQINGARWNSESVQGWNVFNGAVNDIDLIAASRMVITSDPRAIVTSGAGLSLTPTLVERLALAGREVVPQTHWQVPDIVITNYRTVQRPSIIHPPVPPPEPAQSGAGLPKVSITLNGEPVRNNNLEPFPYDNGFKPRVFEISVEGGTTDVIDMDYLFFMRDPQDGLIEGTKTGVSAHAFDASEKVVSESLVRLEISQTMPGIYSDGGSREVQFVIRFNQRVEINGQSAGYAWEPACGGYWHGALRSVDSGGYLFVLNFELFKQLPAN